MAILVSGGSKGIGRAIALRFATHGNAVFVNYHGDDSAAEATAQDIRAQGAEPHLVKGDVGTPAGARAVIDQVADRIDRLDQLVHCAVDPYVSSALEADLERFTQAAHVNGLALLYLVEPALALMAEGSTIFFISSRGSHTVVPNYVGIGLAKALAESLIRYLAVELAPRGIRANTVSASALPTDALRAVMPDLEDRLPAMAAANPSGRNVDFDDVTALIEFLASPAAAMIQGRTIMVDGGLTLR
jgi:NAD(P)-dependent dehydrogenase (short-subunit alcohol dehydrogenase family)